MKRHISIFALLLSAFVVVGSAAGAVTQTVNGGYYFVESVLNGDDLPNAKRLSVNGDGVTYQTQVKEGEQVTFIASPEAGLRVAEWGTLIKLSLDTDRLKYSKYDWTDATSDSKDWTGKPDDGRGFLAVNFKYITFSISFNANGGSGTSMPSAGTFDIRSTIDLPKCTYTKEGYGMTEWTNAVGATFADGEKAIPGKRFWNPAITNFSPVLYANWTGKTYAATCPGVNCTVTPSAANGTYDRTFTVTWIKAADVRETSTVTVYDGADTARQIMQRTTNTTSFDFKMSDLGKYYESVVIEVSCTKNERHDLTLKKGVGVKAISWKTNGCDWVRSETDVNLPGLLASTTWAVKVEDVDVERGYDGPNPDSGTMSVDVTRELKGTSHQYIVDYDLQGGTKKSGGKYPYNETFGDSFNVSAPTKTDRTFLGWIVVTNKDDLTCAKWGTSADDVTRDVLPDKPCVNENDATYDVFFKNLTSINGEKIWLKAKWSGQTHMITAIAEPDVAGTVTVSGDGEIEEGDNVTLTAVVTNMGYSFCCWTNSVTGLSTNANPWTFTVTADATYTAVFTGNVYKVTFVAMQWNPTVQVGNPLNQDRYFTYGQPYGELPTAAYENDYTLAGWYSEMNGEGYRLDEGSTVSLVKDTTFYGFAVPADAYTIAYNGDGASGEMADQKALCNVGVKLAINCFTRTGYDFAGWTNTVKQSFADGATVTNLAAKGETATLFAVWTPHTYTVTFDRNGGEGDQMPSQPFTYDVEQSLSSNKYTNGKNIFAGWATTGSGEVAYADGAKVVNLTDENGATVQLFAKWEKPSYTNNALSVAADCDRERDDGRQPLDLTAAGEACTAEDVEKDCGGNNRAVKMTSESNATYLRTDTLTGPGTFKFNYKVILKQNRGAKLSVKGVDDAGGFALLSDTNVSDWAEYSVYYNSETSGKFEWMFEMVSGAQGEPTEYFALIDNIRWIPGEHPEPVDGKDNVTISSATVSDGKFTLSFASKAEFDYNLLTNANLLINSWGVMETLPGNGSTLTFEPMIIEGQPQLFYKVETIQKQD